MSRWSTSTGRGARSTSSPSRAMSQARSPATLRAEKRGGTWMMVPMNRGRIAWIASALGRSALCAATRPSASSVSRSSPHRTVNRYVFCPSITNGTVLVASPSAIGRQPDASGSSVPAWPARLALNRRLITDTACVEVMPIGLSSTTQPCTSCFSRLAWRGGFPSHACGEEPAPDGASAPNRWSSGRGPVSLAVTGDAGIFASFVIVTAPKVALHVRRPQQLFDALGLREALVDAETDIGRELEVHAVGDLAAQPALVALERGEHFLHVAAAKRHDVDGGELEVRAQAHLRHRDEVALDHRVMHLAAREDVRDRVADDLAGAQRALGRAGSAVAMMVACHENSSCKRGLQAALLPPAPIDFGPMVAGGVRRRPEYWTQSER